MITLKRMAFLFAIALVLFFFGARAFAQGVCNPTGTATVVFYQDLTAGASLTCTPEIAGGTGIGFTMRTNAFGAMTWVHCKQTDGTYKTSFGAATWARIVAGDLKPDTPLADPSLKAVWCPFEAEMYASQPKPASAAVWKVAPNSATPTRPTYAFAAGVRSKTTYSTDPRIAVGSLCDITVSVVEGAVTYAQVLPGRVSVCVKQ